MNRGNIVAALYALAAAAAVIAVAYTINTYFGDSDGYDSLRAGFDTLTAVLAVLRDLFVLGLAIAMLLAASAWHLARDRRPDRSIVVAACYIVGGLSVVIGIAAALNNYFGEPDNYETVESASNTFTAVLSFLRDLVLFGMGVGSAVLALGWHIDRGDD